MPHTQITDTTYLAVGVRDGWNTFWGVIEQPLGPFIDIAIVAGVVLVLFAIFFYFWKKARKQQANASVIFWSSLVGLFLLTPTVAFPLLASAADIVLNAIVKIADHFL